MSLIRKGDTVRQIVQVIEGTVAGFSIDTESGARQFLVEWTDSEGVVHSRYFNEGEVEAVVQG